MNTVKKIVVCVAALSIISGVLPFIAPPVQVAAVVTCDDTSATCPTPPPATAPQVCKSATDACSTFIKKYIDPFVKLLTAVVGVGAAISIVTAGITYASSADDPSKVSKAKTRIVQTLIGLLAYLFLFAFLNYVIPGGLI
ncbi:MAG TPA: hypothetical protein VLF43_05265 [Candidatus Saccharimonadales bacterium]|nr:hypothetical protein [Candidatus Saccharimonadales bacterium]